MKAGSCQAIASPAATSATTPPAAAALGAPPRAAALGGLGTQQSRRSASASSPATPKHARPTPSRSTTYPVT